MKMKVKVLFDANVPRSLRRELPRHTVKTMQEMGWGRMKDKEALMTRAAQEGFEVFVTKDLNIKHQVNLEKSKVILYELHLPGSERKREREHLKSQMPALREFLYEVEFERRYERQQQMDEQEPPSPHQAPSQERDDMTRKRGRDFGMEP